MTENTEDYREYELPHGWKKIGQKRNISNSKAWDFYIFAPDGTKLRSTVEVKKYLEENPDIPCDLELTNTFRPRDLQNSPVKKNLQSSRDLQSSLMEKNLQSSPMKKTINSLLSQIQGE